MIMDGSTGTDRNCTVATRESKKAPYLLVTVAGDDVEAPGAPTNVKVAPTPNEATVKHGALEISFTVPEKAFAYQVMLNTKVITKLNTMDIPRWQIPFAGKPGTTQKFVLRYLDPDAPAAIDIAAVDAAGNVSTMASAGGRTSAAIVVPKLPLNSGFAGKLEVHPDHGNELEAWPESFKPGDALFSDNGRRYTFGAPNGIFVPAARGEIASFQLHWMVARGQDDASIKFSGLDDITVKLWNGFYIKDKNAPEYAIPTGEKLPLEHRFRDGNAGIFIVDLIVPPNAKPGERHGEITIGEHGLKMPLTVKIYSAVIPPEMHFNPELNAYDEPGGAGSEMFFDSHRLAHYHRCSLNSVPYSQRGEMHAGCAPKVGADGHVIDWSMYDKNFGPLLDGSAFKDNPRAGVPVPVLYLPMNENYPLAMKANYDAGIALEGKGWKARHDLFGKPPELAFSKTYQDAFVTCTSDFVRHFEEKKYNRTLAEGFFNNKWSFSQDGLGGTAWVLDEPSTFLDWNALRFYSGLFHTGLKEKKETRFVFRGDVSRPNWQGSCMDGLMELMNSNNEQFQLPDIMREHRRRMPAMLYTYGAANSPDRSNLETVAWCLKAHCMGCDGVVPWQSLGGDKSFDVGDLPDQGNALIVDGRKRFGVNAIASLRVFAFRQGAQLVELLRLLEIKKGWSRAHSGALVSQIIPLGAEFKQGFADDATPLKFEKLNADDFVRLKEAILRMLEE